MAAETPRGHAVIPRIIHRIWLGGPMPEEYRRYGERWQDLHPGWVVKTWGEPDLGWLENAAAFAAASTFAEKADVARYEIVHRDGGVYVDCDFEPLRNIEPLLADATLVIGEEEPAIYNCAFFAATPGHPVLRYAIDTLPESQHARPDAGPNVRTGPWFWTRCIRRSGHPGDATRVVGRALLYPYSYTQGDLRHLGFDHAYAVHHWGAARAHPRPSTPVRIRTTVQRNTERIRWVARALRNAGVDLARARGVGAGRRPRATPMGPDRLLVNTTAGFPILADPGDLLLTPSLVIDGAYDRPFLRFLRRELAQGDVAVDVGANIGLFTIQMARRVGHTGRVFAFEPNPACSSMLCDSLYLNRMRGLRCDVSVHTQALGRTHEVRTLWTSTANRAMGTLHPEAADLHGTAETVEVEVVPLDQVLVGIPLVRLVKIDVEGFEHEVLAGMTTLIAEKRVQLIDIELIDDRAGSSWEDLVALLRRLAAEHAATFATIDEEGRRQPISLPDAIHAERLSHLVIELPAPGRKD